MELKEFQERIREIYYEKDSARGTAGTFQWLAEEVGELARALRTGNRENLDEEFADVLAWLVSLATLCGVSMEEAAGKYRKGCPKCMKTPCLCG
ncbi:MAG: nucleotide pyrophosphohydrolase [Armatimonadetes bacterium]|nr:nucleotide pyrophosphohydrolase [Armatimonadota bacterium]